MKPSISKARNIMEKKKILVVDNNRVMIKLMTTFLEQEGHEVVGVEDAFDALDVLREFMPQIIYLDLVMPKIGGEDLCKIFRTIPILANCYIAVVSAAALEKSVDIFKIGADAYIAKGPFATMRPHILETISESDAPRRIPASHTVRGEGNLHPRQITKELISQNKHLQIILESMSQGVLAIAHNRVFYANPAALFLLQVKQENLLGASLDRIREDSFWEQLVSFIETSLSDMPAKEDCPFIKIHDRYIAPQCLTVEEDGWSQIVLLTDITEHKRAEALLRESDERYSALFDRSLDCVFLTDFEGRFLDANLAALDLLGYQREDISQHTFESLLTADQVPLALRAVAEIKATGFQESPNEYRVRKKDGTFVLLETQSSLIYRDGKPFAVQGIARDITERKRVEAALRRFEILVTHSRDPIFFVRHDDLRVMEANDAATKAYGYSREHLLTLTVPQLMATDTMDLVHDQMAQADKHGILFEAVHRRSDGSTFPVEVSSRGETVNGVRMLISVVRDITDRKVSEEILKLSEERFRKVFEGSPIGIAFLNEQREIFLTNQSYRDFLGYSEAEIIEQGPLGLVHPDDWDATMEMSTRLRNGEIPLLHMEQRYVHKEGAIVWSDTHITVLRDSDGRLIHTIGWILDITNRKQAEMALQQSEERLRQIARCLPDLIWTMDLSGR